jgi:hypothetical protein
MSQKNWGLALDHHYLIDMLGGSAESAKGSVTSSFRSEILDDTSKSRFARKTGPTVNLNEEVEKKPNT